MRRALILAVSLGALSACDSLLEVELPHLLTDAAIEGAGTAQVQVNSAIALFECGYSAFGAMSLGADGAMQSVAGVYSGGHVYDQTPDTGECDTTSTSDAWFDQVSGARALLSTAPGRLVPTGEGVGRGVYDRIQDEWSLGMEGERLSAVSAIYVAMALGHFGEFVCEGAIDGSDWVTPTDFLNLAESWITNNALVHLGATGDFAVQNGISPSAQNMAIAIRSRVRWANRDFAGAASDAVAVLSADPDFTAWVTREAGATRRNKIFHIATDAAFSGLLPLNTWWNPAVRPPNPVTGQLWADPIPFTGYVFLGIMPDGRTLDPGNIPVRWAEEFRAPGDDPTPLANGAVADTRVPHFKRGTQGPQPEEVPARYSDDADDIPYMTWEELTLIQADNELALGGAANLQNAINLVNALRTANTLPTVSGAYLATLTDGNNDAAEVRALLLEERKREFFAEAGRFWSTGIQNTDVIWFPRGQGQTPFQNYPLAGAVRQEFADDEYTGNEYFQQRGGLDARATGCTQLFGSQQPFRI